MLPKTLVFPFNHPVHNDHLLSSPICSSSPNITTKKAKQLPIMTINFQSIWRKKEELDLTLVENNMLLLGVRHILTHVFMIVNSYHLTTSFWRDRKDGWGGVKFKIIKANSKFDFKIKEALHINP